MKKITGWISTLITGLLGSFIYDFIKEKPLFTSLWNIVIWLYENILNYKLSLWFVVLLYIFVFSVFLFLRNRKEIVLPSYTEDYFDGLLYRWKWQISSNKKEISINLQSIEVCCNKCNTPLKVSDNYNFGLKGECVRCGKYHFALKYMKDIEILILDNYNKKNYGL